MSLIYPPSASGLNYITYPVGPTTAGATLTASASTNTKGAYAQLIASSPFTCNYLHLIITGAGTSGGVYLVDIATGGAGSETVVVPNIIVDRTAGAAVLSAGGAFNIPLTIASGTRIAARCQSASSNATIEIAVVLVAAGQFTSPTTWTQNGANTATSRGTQIDPGGTANVKGSYVEISSSLAALAQLMIVQFSGKGVNSTINGRWCVDVATGASSSEVVLVPDIRPAVAANQTLPIYPRCFSALTYIPASTRLAVRASCSQNDATARLFDCAILTATAPAQALTGGLSRVALGY